MNKFFITFLTVIFLLFSGCSGKMENINYTGILRLKAEFIHQTASWCYQAGRLAEITAASSG